MKQHSTNTAISTAALFCQTDPALAEPKFTLLDLAASTGEVAAVLSACWMVHLFI